MNRFLLVLCLVMALPEGRALAAEAAPARPSGDEAQIREVYQKYLRKEPLTEAEKGILLQTIEARRKALEKAQASFPSALPAQNADYARGRQLMQKQRAGQKLTAEEQAFIQRIIDQARARAATNAPAVRSNTGLIPLNQMTGQQSYKGQAGGLYGGGSNQPPATHGQSAQAEAARMAPLDSAGKPAPDGKLVLLSIGMSNTTQEFSRFKELADRDPGKSPFVIVVDGAQGGKDAADWNDPQGGPWQVAEERLRAAGASPQQVQALWIKQALKGPAQLGEFPGHAEALQAHLAGMVRIARSRYPNARLAYLSSRTFGGYATTALNPEPYAYESGFAVRALIQKQIGGDLELNWNSAKGPVKAPLLLWGPYLWGDGATPRQSDGLTWVREDFAADGTHPSPGSGREKVARLLLAFFANEGTAKPWFAKPK